MGVKMAEGNAETIGNFLSRYVPYHRDTSLDIILSGTGLVWCSSTPGLQDAMGGNMVYFIQLFYNGVSLTSPRIQIVFPYEPNQTKMGWRVYTGNPGSWSAWKTIQAS